MSGPRVAGRPAMGPPAACLARHLLPRPSGGQTSPAHGGGGARSGR
jgi:hypothetical protein